MRLIINGQDIDLTGATEIKQTKQTNDIASIETRDTNYTNSFNLPKTPPNVKAMEFLSLVGNNSNIPYQKNECYLYSDTGECFIYKGWAIIKETTSVYKCYIYDGNLELYKAIENFMLSDLDLSELEHTKDLQTVIDSWTNEDYRYILADYNGKTYYFNQANEKVLNIDYLVPSVRVKYLWNKIFQTFGFSYSGSVFQTQEFDNLWMTYPKGLNTGDADELIFDSDDYSYQRQILNTFASFTDNAYYAKADSWNTNNLQGFSSGIFMRVAVTGTYRLDISGIINRFANWSGPISQIIIGRNTETQANHPNNVIPTSTANNTIAVIYNIQDGEQFEGVIHLNLIQYDSISIVIKKQGSAPFYRINEDTSTLNVEFYKINPNSIDFAEALINFPTKDFIKEIVMRFGLSLFKDKYTNHYHFLTMAERLQFAEVNDWTDKYDSKISENYIYGNYAQQNILRHKYNDPESNYDDGTINVDNANISDNKVLFQSRIYAPEKDPVDYFGRPTKVYKMFDKEIQEDGTIKYKPLDGRFYFLRCEKVCVSDQD